MSRGKLGMDGETQNQGRRPVETGLPGDFLVALKLPDVPRAGGAGYPQAAAFFFRTGKAFQEVLGMGMGIGEHQTE
jgi:hypothetical protein